MIRRPPISSRPDTLLSLHDALPIFAVDHECEDLVVMSPYLRHLTSDAFTGLRICRDDLVADLDIFDGPLGAASHENKRRSGERPETGPRPGDCCTRPTE